VHSARQNRAANDDGVPGIFYAQCLTNLLADAPDIAEIQAPVRR
jgi:hypothetical protein